MYLTCDGRGGERGRGGVVCVCVCVCVCVTYLTCLEEGGREGGAGEQGDMVRWRWKDG